MFKFLNNRKQKKGQSTLEYAILIIIIIGALLSLQVYIKRGIQGRLKSSADDIGMQFSDGNTNVVKIRSVFSNESQTFKAGVSKTALLTDEKTITAMNSEIVNVQQEYWGN